MDRRSLVSLLLVLTLACLLLLAGLKIFRLAPTAPADPGRQTAEPISPSSPQNTQKTEAAPARKPRLIDNLRSRLGEQRLREIAQRSVSIEDRAREDLGETEAAYQRMAEEWASLCRDQGINEAERDAIEDEAIRKGWVSPPPR